MRQPNRAAGLGRAGLIVSLMLAPLDLFSDSGSTRP